MDLAFDEHFARVAIDNIYWDHGGSFYTDKWDFPRRDGDCHCFYARCKSGKKWFWCVRGWIVGQSYIFDETAFKEHGWTDSEAHAFIEGTAAIKRFAAGRPVIAQFNHGFAYHELKQINKTKRAAQWRPTDTNSKVVEYLYGYFYGGDDISLKRFRITKRTAKRIYYSREAEYINEHGEPIDFGNIRSSSSNDNVIGYVNRQKLEADGKVDNRGVHWSASDSTLYASLQGLLGRFGNRYRPEDKPNLQQLKADMAAAHPDRGGSNAAFIEARKAYLDARRQHALRERDAGRA